MIKIKPLVLLAMAISIMSVGCEKSPKLSNTSNAVAAETTKSKNNSVAFDWFEYRGDDEYFKEKPSANEYQNPIVAGFYPDPSITRKGDDYYMVVSSFAYAPGIPILHSRDLVNWKLIGHALERAEQFDFSGLRVSRGVFAPTIRYHDGLFYIINTAVDTGGNFIVTAEDPAGKWSKPHYLPEIGGIDPDIFFDDDGKVYIAHNNAPEGEPLYDGHRAIWLWEYNLKTKQVVKDSGRVIVNGGVDLSSEPIWIEAPHIYKINGWYYLLCAEGGTAYQHSEVVFRTRSLNDPFVPYENNPILTQRDLDINRSEPVTTAGHADIIQTPEGEWWAIFLATRTYDKTFYNSGRETFLLPVTWENEWPHILEQGKPIPKLVTRPSTKNSLVETDQLNGNFIWRDDFNDNKLNPHWSILRRLTDDWYELNNGKVHLNPSIISMTSHNQPMFIGRRQQHMTYQASTALQLPVTEQISAGIVAFQNAKYHYYLGVKKLGDGYQIFIEQIKNGEVKIVGKAMIHAKEGQQITLEISGNKANISFAYQLANSNKITLAENLDGKILSTAIAKGFVGTLLGMHTRIEQ